MLSDWVDYGILDYMGIKIFDGFVGKNTFFHIELNDSSNTNVVFLQGTSYHQFYFGTFEGKYTDEPAQEDLDELNEKILNVKKPKNQVEPKNLSHLLLGILCEKGFEKSVINYYKERWSTQAP